MAQPPNLAPLKRLAEEKILLKKHSLEWLPVSPSNRALSGRCKRCGFTVTVNTNPLAKQPIQGPAVLFHCDGQALTFDEAEEMFTEAAEGTRSIPLGVDLRLVQLASDRYGVQFKNTYIIRICANGYYILNTAGRINEELAKIISCYTPVRLVQNGSSWFYAASTDVWVSDEANATDLTPYRDLDIVDSAGELQPRVKAQ
jgi:hypothetical protein